MYVGAEDVHGVGDLSQSIAIPNLNSNSVGIVKIFTVYMYTFTSFPRSLHYNKNGLPRREKKLCYATTPRHLGLKC